METTLNNLVTVSDIEKTIYNLFKDEIENGGNIVCACLGSPPCTNLRCKIVRDKIAQEILKCKVGE